MFSQSCCLKIPRMKSSWCGCSLTIGTKIISILSLLTSIGIVLLRGVQTYLMVYGTSALFDDNYGTKLCLYSLMMSAGAIRLIPSALLIRAAYRRQTGLCLPWLISDVLTRFLDVAILVLATQIPDDLDDVVIYAILIVVGQYLWWIVFSFYHQLKEEVNGETDPLLPNGQVTIVIS